jgi:hypothetical protein
MATSSTQHVVEPGTTMVFQNRTAPMIIEISFPDGTTIECMLVANSPLRLTAGDKMVPTVTLKESGVKLGDIREVEG